MNSSSEAISLSLAEKYSLVDRWTFGYLVIASLGLVWHWSCLPLLLQFLLSPAHLLILFWLYKLPDIRNGGDIARFFANWYPLLLILGFYSEVGEINRAVGISHDRPLQQMEEWIFGSQVAVEWIRTWPNTIFNWLVHLGYSLYYFVVVSTPMVISRLVSPTAGQRLLLMALITFYTCYTIFLLMPTAGPCLLISGNF